MSKMKIYSYILFSTSKTDDGLHNLRIWWYCILTSTQVTQYNLLHGLSSKITHTEFRLFSSGTSTSNLLIFLPLAFHYHLSHNTWVKSRRSSKIRFLWKGLLLTLFNFLAHLSQFCSKEVFFKLCKSRRLIH